MHGSVIFGDENEQHGGIDVLPPWLWETWKIGDEICQDFELQSVLQAYAKAMCGAYRNGFVVFYLWCGVVRGAVAICLCVAREFRTLICKMAGSKKISDLKGNRRGRLCSQSIVCGSPEV